MFVHKNYDQENCVCVRLMGTAVSEMKQESPSLIDKLLLTLNEITTVSSQISRNAAEKNGDLKLINCNLT